MVLESNRDLVQRRLMECLSRDRTKHQVAEVTSLGLVQMTRKKLGIGLLETFSEPCDICAGRGVIVHHEPHMRAKSPAQAENTGEGQQKSGKGKKNKNQPPKQEVAKVVTAESASQINSVVAKIAASTIGDHDVAAPNEDPSLTAVLDALPEPSEPGQGKRKSKRVTSGGIVTPKTEDETEKDD
jgi:ribonuclease E